MIPTREYCEEYYKKHNRKYVVAVDFDFTLCQSNYPNCGDEIKPVCDYIRYIAKSPYCELILWTCRQSDYLIDAIKWCDEHGIRFDEINRQGYFDDTKFTESRKIFCNMLIDDTNYNFDINDFKYFMEVESLWR